MKPSVTSQKQDMAAESLDTSLTRYKFKVVLIIALTIIVSMTITILVYISVMKPIFNSPHQMPTTVIRVIAKDSEEKQNVDLEYKVNRELKTAYVTSRDKNGELVDGFKDLAKGVEAFRKTNENVCFIAKMIKDDENVNEDENDEQEHLEEKSQVVAVNESRMFVVLNDTIYPTVLRLAAGEEIYRFCANLRAVWMLPEEEVASEVPRSGDDPTSNPVRQKRWLWKWYGGGRHYGGGGGNCYYSCYGFWWKKCFRRCYYYW